MTACAMGNEAWEGGKDKAGIGTAGGGWVGGAAETMDLLWNWCDPYKDRIAERSSTYEVGKMRDSSPP